MAIERFCRAFCAAKVAAAAAGSQGLGLPAHSARAPQPCRLRSNRKSILWAPELLLLHGTPRAKLTNVFPTPPSRPLPQPNSTVPTPKYLYRYITSKYVLATWKTLVLRKHLVSHLEEKWECLFCTLPLTEPIPVSS